MITDNLTTALIARLEAVKPNESISVIDARAQTEKSLPQIAVSVEAPERHSAALFGVQKCPVTITLEAHPGDDASRADLESWAETIEQALNSPVGVKLFINGADYGIQCDNWIYDGGATGWDESTFQAIFSAEAWCVRAA